MAGSDVMTAEDRDWGDTPSEEPKPRQISWLWILLAIAAFCLFVQFRGSRGSSNGMGTNHPAVGRALPNLQLSALTGDSQDLKLADLAGDVAVVNFWGPWCHWCVVEFPELATMWGQLHSRENFRFLPVSCSADSDDSDLTELRKETAQFLEQRESKLPTYADPGGFTRRSVVMVLGESGFGYPTTLLLDQKGIIRAVWTGYDPRIGDEIKHLVAELLDEKH
jgi:thiol-disulfide isomerase/thioredoxin